MALRGLRLQRVSDAVGFAAKLQKVTVDDAIDDGNSHGVIAEDGTQRADSRFVVTLFVAIGDELQQDTTRAREDRQADSRSRQLMYNTILPESSSYNMCKHIANIRDSFPAVSVGGSHSHPRWRSSAPSLALSGTNPWLSTSRIFIRRPATNNSKR